MAKFPNWGVGTDGSATNLANGIPNIVTKVSTNTITSNTTLANDSELTNISLAVGTWEIEVLIWVTGAAAGAGNLKTAWNFATGTLTGTPNRDCDGPSATSTAAPTALVSLQKQAGTYSSANTYGLGSTTVIHKIMESCPNFVVATVGTLSIQFAQGTSTATSTVIQPGTRVKCRQIA